MNIKRGITETTKTYHYIFSEEEKKFSISYEGNGDLYFCLYSKNNEETFIIDKSNYEIYSLFEKLYTDILNCNIYEMTMLDRSFCDTYGEYEEENKRLKELNEWHKKTSGMNRLVKDKRIIWVNDDSVETSKDKSNQLIIQKVDDAYALEFSVHDPEYLFSKPIRIRNSGSRFEPFNICFMKFYDKLQQYDPDYHQMHIEELMYQKQKKYNK